ncbi:hypothetical protein BKA66DRAFT_572823 [Pyrenochaeta sp. MPI-SDFR-AT-0127]|nr:hypothetical protein BKA66DRAFT_572823 [Pyrenochaeta sp. MPI-SDFR-AT-0127]
MAVHRVEVAPQNLITPFPTPLPLLARQDSSQKFEYPACRDDPNGPCMLQTSSSAECGRKVATMSGLSFRHEYWCRCTNGYFDRSSECYNGCYGASRTSHDLESISRKSRMQQLECESYSLGIEEDQALKSKTLFVANRTSVLSRSTASERQVPGASVGATAPPNVEETAAWVQRPSTTNQAQQGVAVSSYGKVKWNGLGAVTMFLALSGMCGFL